MIILKSKQIGTTLKIFFLLFFCSCTFIFFSCENFLNGSLLKENIENQIDYANAPEYSVSVASINPDWGTITTGGGDHKKKVTDSISLGFNVNDGYKFLKWKAVNKSENSVSLADYVSFETQTATSTKVELIQGSDDILITPVCAQKFAVTGNFTDNGQATYNRDSTISITFNQNLAESTEEINNLSKIIISVSGLTDVNQYFNTPVIVDNKIIISCKADNLIPVSENSFRTVTVTIPSDFCYYSDDVKMELGQKYILSYTIDSSTTEKTSIKFSKEESGDANAIFTVDGVTATGSTTKYSIGQTIKLSYKNTDDYIFVGFAADTENTVFIGEPEYDDSKKTYTSTLTVLAGGKEISVIPVTTLRDKITLRFVGENGSVTPVDTKSFYKNESFDLNFTASNGYAFYEWQLLDFQNKPVTISDYLELEEKNGEQSVKIKAAGTSLTLKGIGEERPKIKFLIPANGKEGLVRNTTIKILFTQPMEASTLTPENIKVTQGLLRSTNQKISIDANSAADILDEYQINSACDLLTIPLKTDKYYTANAYVNVTITKDVKNQHGISFEEDYEYQFQVSSSIDSIAPVINTVYAGIPISDAVSVDDYKLFNIIDYRTADASYNRPEGNTIAMINTAYASENNKNNLNNFNIYDKLTVGDKIKIYVDAGDISGSGTSVNLTQTESNVAKIGYKITSVMKDGLSGEVQSYNNPDNTFTYESEIEYSSDINELKNKTINGKQITTGTTFSLNLNNLDDNGMAAPDGILRIDLYAIDKNNNDGYNEQYWYKYGNGFHTFYVIKDHTAPTISVPKWQKTYFDDNVIGRKNGVKNDSVIKFKIDEEFSGIKEIILELKDSENNSKTLSALTVSKNFENDNRNSGSPVESQSYSNSKISLDKTKSEATKFSETYSSYYYINNLIYDSLLEGEYNLSITVKDAAGNLSEPLVSQIVIDRTAPTISSEGPKVATYSYNSAIKNQNEKIYPRVGNFGITGAQFKGSPTIPDGDGKDVRWFYTNAYNNSSSYGIFLHTDATDTSNLNNYRLFHHVSYTDEQLKSYSDSTIDSKLAAIKKASFDLSKFSNHSVDESYSGDFYSTGVHTIIYSDDAGNLSEPQTFVVVKDDVLPLRTTDKKYTSTEISRESDVSSTTNNGYRDIKYLASLEVPSQAEVTITDDPSEKWQRKVKGNGYSGDLYKFLEWWEGKNTHATEIFLARKITIKGTRQQIKDSKIVLYLTGTTAQTNYINPSSQPTLVHYADEYWPDAWPSRTSSGTAQYYVCRTYNQWRSQKEGDGNNIFQPAFPPGTDLSGFTMNRVSAQAFLKNIPAEFLCYDSSYIPESEDNHKAINHFNTWKDYTAGTNIEIPVCQNSFGIDIADKTQTPNRWGIPICVCFKDNCGNLNFFNITRPSWNEYATFAYLFDYSDL